MYIVNENVSAKRGGNGCPPSLVTAEIQDSFAVASTVASVLHRGLIEQRARACVRLSKTIHPEIILESSRAG